LHVRQPGRSRFERINVGSGLPGGPIRSLAFGSDGVVWAGSNEGLARIDPASLRVVTYRHDPKDEGTLSGHEVEALALGGDGTLWVGTGSGLNALDPVTGRVVRITREAGRPSGLPNNWVPDLMVASDGRLWVATQGGAVILKSWDGRTATFEDVASRLGRAPEPVDALIEDEEGYVWLGPRLRVDPRAMTAREFSRADGLDFRTFFIASRSRTSRGYLLFGSPEGLAIVRPGLLRDWTYEPPILVTDVRVEGRRLSGASRSDRLALSVHERGFQMSFASLDLSAPDRTRYRYMLEGFDPEWNTTDATRRTLTYTNLTPGAYRLRVQGSNRTGVFSTRERIMAVTVEPAFHQTRAFRGVAGLAGIALVYLIHRLRLRRLEVLSRELERIVRTRTSELQAAYAQIEEASLTDPLTGLRNRRFLEKSIQADLDVVARAHLDGRAAGPAADLVFLLIDIDHFKRVNDTHGHGAGDAVLRQAAAVLSEQTRSSDYVVRWGGEEFLVVARFVSRDEGPTLAEKIRAAIASRSFPIGDDLTLALTCSVGFAAYPFSRRQPRAINWQTVIEVADRGLYAAKGSGRNRCVGFDASDSEDPEKLVDAQAAGSDAPGLRRLGS
jgi:diguanylate cyclase (GGDEF)-like protein